VLGLDDRLAGLGGDDVSLVIALTVALLLGLRHATDPDHLTALSALVLTDDESGTRRAGRLGLAWGLGHAVTLTALGLPVVLFSDSLPDWAQRAAEGLIGVIIAVLAVRLLLRWRRGYFHVHPHEHGDGTRHAHPHVHEHAPAHGDGDGDGHAHAHDHPHAEGIGRSPRAAFGIGLVHGAGGSAGVGILLIAGINANFEAVVALLLFAAGTALSMAFVSAAWGRVLVSRAVERRLALLAPVFGTTSLAFGCWYGLGALS
jgi:ABC-type nickel/cobalt efflux system permease component RcnA